MEPKAFTDSQLQEDAATAVEALGQLLLPALQDEAQRVEAMRLLTALQFRLAEAASLMRAIEDSLKALKTRMDQARL